MPAEVWSDPKSQAWQRIKDNGAREVWRARLDGKAYYVKFFAARGWADRLKRALRTSAGHDEWHNGLYALRAGIPCVRPAGFCEHVRYSGRECAVLVTEALDPSQRLDEFWLALSADSDAGRRRQDVEQLVELLAEMIARAHQCGFEHLDMHAANILVQPLAVRRYRTAFVDLQSARLGVPVSDAAVVRNLSQLNQWFAKHSTIGDRLRFLRAYFRWRHEFESSCEHSRALGLSFDELATALAREAVRHFEHIGARRDRRVFRNGRYFARLALPGGWRGMAYVRCKHASDESPVSALTLEPAWWRQALAQPLRWFADERTELAKRSHSAQVARTVLSAATGGPHDGDAGKHQPRIPVIIKRPLARNWQRRLSLWLSPSRSMRGWRIGQALLHRDIATARPLAYLERRVGPVVVDSLLVTEALPGAADLESHLRTEFASRTPRSWLRHKLELAELLARHVRRLTDRGFRHRDCKAPNILVVSHPDTHLLWIDLDGVRPVRRMSGAQRLEPLVRLHVSLLDVAGLTRTDRVRFLKRYFARFGAPADEWRRAWRAMAPAIERKLAARADRLRWKLAHYGRP
jgi:hypothetical protein